MPDADKGPGLLTDVLANERRRRGLSLQAVADVVGTSKSSVHDWERGIRTPSITNAHAWAASLGYRLTLTRATPPTPKPTAKEANQ